ncbi:MAG: urea transporter [Bacteroidales bacterium]|nr:urea transporter [Bacteroidales bacterium]
MIEKIKNITSSVLNSYSQVFFSKNKVFATILLIVSFIDPWMGLCGLISILTANFVSYFMGFYRENIKSGLYGFNPLLVGLGISIYYAAQWEILIFIIIASLLTLFISFVLEGMLAKYGLPFLSLPFLFAIWLLAVSFSQFHNFELNPKGLYTANELYAIGGLKLVNAYEWLQNIPIPASLKTYFLSIGAIFFNFNLFAGILISIGLLIHSRVSFLMSIIGFYAAFSFYQFLGTPYESLSYTFYGFNFILSAIAIGSYFLIPSIKTLLWMIILIPVLVIITIGTDKIFAHFYLPVYSLPFNLVVLGFVYSLKLRISPKNGLKQTYIQHKNAEQNLYFQKNWEINSNPKYQIEMSLPVFGKWTINQGIDGEITHKSLWKHAWDFVITDKDKNEFKNEGNQVEDYFCHNKAVVAPADGTIVEIIDGIEDNIIGEMNLVQNWGNTVVVMHGYGLYSQMSHLKAGTIKVFKGMSIKKGQHIANAGNSGRSPYPHLHFQFQSSPIVGSKTIEYPFSNYILSSNSNTIFKRNSLPEKNDTISNIEASYLIKHILSFIPGTKYSFTHKVGDSEQKFEIVADADIFNNTFIETDNKKETLYFKQNDNLFNAINYKGKNKSTLFVFFKAMYLISFGIYKNIKIDSHIPVHLTHNKLLLLIQDIFATFGLFLHSEYISEFVSVDDDFSPSKAEIKAVIRNKIFKKTIKETNYKIILSQKGNSSIEFKQKEKTHLILWQKKELS